MPESASQKGDSSLETLLTAVKEQAMPQGNVRPSVPFLQVLLPTHGKEAACQEGAEKEPIKLLLLTAF